MQLLPLDFAKSLVNELLNPTPAPQEVTEIMQNEAVQTTVNQNKYNISKYR